MRTILAALAFTLSGLPAAAQQHAHDHGGGGGLPAGWQGRVDRAGQDLADVRFMQHGGGFHVITGPHVILWNAANTANGAYRASVTYTQSRAPDRLEGYGLLVGGRDLDAPAQDYLYFLIRHDGRYMIRHRAGDEVHTLAEWTPADAIRTPGAEGGASNTLTIEAGANRVRFLINDAEVQAFDRVPMLNTDGIVGFRIGHHLDVMIDRHGVEPIR